MNRRYRRNRSKSKVKNAIMSHIENNMRQYLIITIIFLIGIVAGVIFINNTSEGQTSEITEYINTFTQDLKDNRNINNLLLLKESIKNNILLALFLWFMGSTVIGISIVYITICFRGFCLGYTISSIILTLGTRKRITFFTFKYITSKHIIYTMYISTCCKWHEASQFYNGG